MHTWRSALSRLADNGRLNGFSSFFTRRVGLEVVVPLITAVTADRLQLEQGETFTISWDGQHNPPYTQIRLDVSNPNASVPSFVSLPFTGQQSIQGLEVGRYKARLTAICTLNGEARRSFKGIDITVTERLPR